MGLNVRLGKNFVIGGLIRCHEEGSVDAGEIHNSSLLATPCG